MKSDTLKAVHLCMQDNSDVGIRAMLTRLESLLEQADAELWHHLQVQNKVCIQLVYIVWNASFDRVLSVSSTIWCLLSKGDTWRLHRPPYEISIGAESCMAAGSRLALVMHNAIFAWQHSNVVVALLWHWTEIAYRMGRQLIWDTAAANLLAGIC